MAAEVSDEFQRHVSALMVVLDIYPELMKKMIVNTWPPPLVSKLLEGDPGQKLVTTFTPKQQQIVKSIDKDGYRLLDTDLMYKIIRHFGLVDKPSRGWGNNPRLNDNNQGDDIERMRHYRNNVVHRPRLKLTEMEYNELFTESIEIAKRLDNILGNPSNEFEKKMENIKCLTLSCDMGNRYLANSADYQCSMSLNNNRQIHLYLGGDIKHRIENSESETESTRCVLHVIDPVMTDPSEIVRLLEELKSSINEGKCKIKLLSVEKGSLILHVIVSRVLKEIQFVWKELILLFTYIFKLDYVDKNCGQQIDVVLAESDYIIMEDQSADIEQGSSEPNFKPVEILKMNVVVPNSSFQSLQALHGEVHGFISSIFTNLDINAYSGNGSLMNIVMTKDNKEREKPSQPVGPLKISDVYKTEAKLSWEQRENEDELPITEYIIESREKGKFAYTEVGKVKPNLTTFQLTGLKEDEEYFVQVKAVNNIGQSKPLEASFKTQRSKHVPSKPKNFQVKEKTSTTVTLQWQEPESDGGLPIKLYSLERKENALGHWGNKEKINATSTEFTVKGLLEGVDYFFRICAENDIGFSELVDLPQVIQFTNELGNEKPSQPVGPLKISDVYKTEAKLSWEQRENEDELPITEYIIESREKGKFAYTEVGKVKPNLTTFQLTGLKEDEEYFVQVKAVNNIGQSKPLEASFKTQRSKHVPSKPKNFQVKEKTSTTVTLQWQEPESDGGLPIKLYSLERKENALGHWGNKEKINATSTEFTVKGLLEGVDYFFRICAENDIGFSELVDLPQVIQFTNELGNEKPSQPVGPLKISDVYKTEAKLSWEQRENEDELPITEYIIESREKGKFAYTEVGKVKPNLTTFQLTGLKEDEEYFVQVKAVNNIGQSKPLEASFKTQRSKHVPSKPKNFQVKEKTSTTVTLQWQEPESDGGLPIKLYSLERKENALGHWGNKEKINATSTEFTVKGLLEGVDYFFRICAENDIGSSDLVDLSHVIQLTNELGNVYGTSRNVRQEQENFYRLSTVIVDETKDSFLHLLDFQLTNQGITLHRFIEKHQHEIYHLCFNRYPCCQCPPGTPTETRGNRVLHPPQLDIFLDRTGNKLPLHNPRSISAPHCCFPVNPNLHLHDLDFTLARLLLVNFTTQGPLERNAIDFLVSSRNKSFAHAKKGKINNNEYQKSMADIEKQLLVLARVYGKEAETKQKLRDITKQPLNAAICQQLHNTLLDQCRLEEKINRLLADKEIPEYLTKDLEDIKVIEGCDARLELWTREVDVNVEWFKGDTKIEASDKFLVESMGQMHRLVVTNAGLTDRGIYATKILGLKRSARLDIEEYFTKNIKKGLKYIEGENIELSCAVLEDNVTAQWEKDCVGVKQCEKFKITDEGKNHKLSIIHINPQDAGNYSVKISDRFRSTTVQVQEYFTKPLDTKTCIEGSNVHFDCEVLEDNQTALWFKNDTEISTSHRYKEESHGKLHRLVVYKTKLDDQGEYSVQIKNCVRRSELIVQEYFTKNLERNVMCIEGDNVNLSCEILDADAVSEWSKDGVILQKCVKYEMQTLGKIHTLSIVGAELQDAGDYSVKINNRLQSTSLKVKENFPMNLERNVEIIDCDKVNISCEDLDADVKAELSKDEAVLHKCEYFTKPLGSRTCIEGESVQFECEVLQDNQTALWFKDGIEVSASDKCKVQRHERLHRLVVNNTQLDDQGKYFVKINNCLLASKLIVQEYFTKTLVNTTCIEGDIVQFECEVLHVNQRALWFKNGIEVSTSTKYKVEQRGRIHRLLVHNTKLDDQGEYSVKIKNCVRRSQLIVQVFFTKPLVTVTCIEGESVQFECEVLHVNQKALWFKGYTEVRTSDKYKVERHERLHRLVVNNANLDDQGEYYVEIKSCVRRSELIVQDYFTLPLRSRISCIEGESIQFECEVLQDNQTAMWFKDDTEVRASERCKMERDGRLHKLVVNKTKLYDQGEYSVKIKDCVRRSQLIIEEIPASFRYLSKEDKGLYLDIIKSGTETRYYIRIVIVGENGVGKTCLLRRLLGEPIEDVTSTDGIDIVHRCKIRLSDGKWIIDKGSNTRKELIIRMRRALNAKSYDDEKTEHKQNIKSSISKPTLTNPNQSGTSQDEHQRHVNRKSIDERIGGIEPSVPNTDDKRQGSDEGLSFPTHELRKSISETHELVMTKEKIEPILDKKLTDNILKKLSKFISDIKKSEIPNEVLVDCGFWDFAGQKHYYPTHNIFLNANAVHLLVADIMKDIKQMNTEGGYDKIGEYIDFWFDSIHSCGAVQTSMDCTGNPNPPVIVVCTGTDKCKDKLEKRKDEFRKQLLSKLKNEDKLKHLRRICCVSNTEPSDTDFVNLRNSIFEFGKNIETFGEKLPLRWIHLEQMLDIVREAGVNILPWSDMADLASKCSINNEMEINLFLKYHHKVGTIIYFESLKEYIILKQQWLADAFRCLVSDKYDDDLKLTQEWKTLEDTGELKPSLISKLFLKKDTHEFYKHEGHLLKLMEMFGIIVKLTTLIDDGKNQSLPAYYMPCMISEKTSISQIYDAFKVQKDNCTPWLCIEFDFMPFDFFNHIFCHYVRKYPVCSEAESERVAIYHGIGVFYLDKLRQKFVVCFSKNTIALQIWQWKQLEHGKCKEILDELKAVIHNVKNKYEPRRVSYSVKAKCCNGNIHIDAGRLRYAELLDVKDDGYVCEEHNVIHDARDFFQTWFEDYNVYDDYVPPQQKFQGIEDEQFNQMCHVCGIRKSVYWCHDCQISMCEECNNQHTSNFLLHVVQHEQDMYTLDYNLKFDNVKEINDIKVLHDGLLVIADIFGQKLITCYTKEPKQQHTIPLPGLPFRIAIVDNNTVAVPLYTTTSVVLVDVREGQVKKQIDVKDDCRGILNIDNQLLLGCIGNKIKEINMSGEVTRTIPLGLCPEHICVGDKGLIYYVDKVSLFCSDTKEKTLFSFNDPYMQEPSGITIDDEGHVLVACRRSNNVFRVSPDGTQSRIIITQIPISLMSALICFNTLSKSVVIGRTKTIYVYKKV